jgi:hypothetical protein
MNTLARLRTWCVAAPLLLLLAGCEGDSPSSPERGKGETPKGEEAKKVLIGKNVFFELKGKERRVIVSSYVCLREGPLEQLLTRKERKEHEAILAFDGDARDIHKALIATGIEPGTTVRFQPTYQPATGPTVKVTLVYEQDGKQVTVPAQRWVRNARTGKDLHVDWIFAGSHLIENPLDPNGPRIYLANDGDIICVSNFESALLDLPINSPKDNSELAWEANTERIPPRGTKVAIILEPVPQAKK